MNFVTLAPAVAVATVVAYMLAARPAARPGPLAWVTPALLSAAFLAFSGVTIAREGVFGFWANHTASLWGNQVWFDLLIAVALGWTLLLPRLRAAGLRPAPWLAFVVLTASIGLLALLSRLLWLEARRPAA
jgi:hypothetical protein